MSLILNQVIVGANAGDAITDQAMMIQRWLRQMGIESTLYAEHIQPGLERLARPVLTYSPRRDERLVIVHHSIGSAGVDHVLSLPVQCVLIYHNITPAEFFTAVDPGLARQMQRGREQLALLRPHTRLALADSAYNERELIALGYAPTGVLPIVLDPARYDQPVNPRLAERLNTQTTTLLFVGRLAPNKKQEDAIKLLYYCRRVDPAAQLVLVGEAWTPAYRRWLDDLSAGLGLSGAVTITGHVPWQDMVTYYRGSHVYVSMSEHEGFGKPLIESMYLGLPVLAYAAASVPETMQGAGVLFRRKDYEALAEWVDLVAHDAGLRQRLIDAQRQRAAQCLESSVEPIWRSCLDRLKL